MTTADRFWKKVDVRYGYECWEWTGARLMPRNGQPGYGHFNLNGKSRTAHSVAWELANKKELPEGLLVCHSCDNPPCCNPSHLFPGTHKDNVADMDSKGRRMNNQVLLKTRGVRHWKARLSQEQVLEIRRRKNEPRKRLALEFNTSHRYISSLICRKKWAWL